MRTTKLRDQIAEKHEWQLAVFNGYIEEALRNGYCAAVTLHALNIMKLRYTELMDDLQNARMMNLWASQLVGNNGASYTACEKWHESFEAQRKEYK